MGPACGRWPQWPRRFDDSWRPRVPPQQGPSVSMTPGGQEMLHDMQQRSRGAEGALGDHRNPFSLGHDCGHRKLGPGRHSAGTRRPGTLCTRQRGKVRGRQAG